MQAGWKFNWTDGEVKTAFLSYTTNNIGDDVQSVVLARQLGEPHLYVNRDQFSRYANEGNIHLIANGFFTCGAFPPPSNFKATYVALCASSIDPAKHIGAIEHLRTCAPIGCRDHHSVKWCQNHGIEAYFASCPSILFTRSIPYNRDGPVVFVDVDPKLFRRVLNGRHVEWLSNWRNPACYSSAQDRFTAVEENLRRYQKASLVVTNRLHVGMPCLGMGVPLVMVETDDEEKWSRFRLTAFPKWVTIHAKAQCARLDMDPEKCLANADAVTEWKSMVLERLNATLDRAGLRRGSRP